MTKRKGATIYRGYKKLSPKQKRKDQQMRNELFTQCFGGSHDSKNV